MNWEETKQLTNNAIHNVFSVSVSFMLNGVANVSSGVFTEPSDLTAYSNRRTDDYDLSGVDARRSDYELEVLNDNLPPSVSPGTDVEIDNKIYTVARIEPPSDGSTVLYLHDTGEVT
jgi:hypothetical protein